MATRSKGMSLGIIALLGIFGFGLLLILYGTSSYFVNIDQATVGLALTMLFAAGYTILLAPDGSMPSYFRITEVIVGIISIALSGSLLADELFGLGRPILEVNSVYLPIIAIIQGAVLIYEVYENS